MCRGMKVMILTNINKKILVTMISGDVIMYGVIVISAKINTKII